MEILNGKYGPYIAYDGKNYRIPKAKHESAEEQSLPKSVSDARYIVYHKGEATEFSVNQRMGGGIQHRIEQRDECPGNQQAQQEADCREEGSCRRRVGCAGCCPE